MAWFKRKKNCEHCHTKKTKREFEDRPTCPTCKIEILLSREGIRHCPIDGTALLKEEKHEILIDRCPKCSGIWLDAGEIEAIKEAGRAEGLAIGIALG